MNNNFNNQNLQSVNNNSVTQQFVPNPQINNPVQNSQPMYQQPEQPQTVNSVTQQFVPNPQVNNPVQNNQPMYQQPMNNINTNMNPMYNNKPKNNKTLFIIIGISVAVIIAIVVLVLVLNNSSKDKQKNEYEEDVNNNVIKDENITPTDSEAKTYKGFKFSKVSGYIYGEESGLMTVQDQNNFVMLEVTKVPFSSVKANYASLESVLTGAGWTVGESKINTYNGSEVITVEATLEGISGLYFILAAPNTSYVYEGFVANKAYTFDYTDVNLVVSISKASTYVGDYSDYSTNFGVDFELKDIQ